MPDSIVDTENAGLKLRITPPDQYVPSIAQAIVASDDAIKAKPKLIRQLVQATLQGLRDIMQNPVSAAHDYVKAVPQNAGREAQMAKAFELYNKYVYPGQKVLGEIDPKRLAEVEQFYVKQGIVEKATPIDELYTNEFVK